MKTSFYFHDEMPFGKHRGKKLSDVPKSYLKWLYDNNRCGQDAFFRFIRDNMDALIMEVEKQKKSRN